MRTQEKTLILQE